MLILRRRMKLISILIMVMVTLTVTVASASELEEEDEGNGNNGGEGQDSPRIQIRSNKGFLSPKEKEDDRDPPPSKMTEEERQRAFERMWEDENNEKEGRDPSDDPMTLQEDPDDIVQAIKKRFGFSEVIQVVDPPDLSNGPEGRDLEGDPTASASSRRIKLVLKDSWITPVQPITALLNQPREPEIPPEEELGVDGDPLSLDGEGSEALKTAELMYKEAMDLLGWSASRDATSFHVLTSVGKGERVEKAFALLTQASLRGHKRAGELTAWGHLLGPLPLDIQAAREKFNTLSEKGYPNSQMGTGFLHALGLEAELSSAMPILHYTFASIAGSAWAQMALGYRHWAGIGVPVSCEKALEQYRRVAATVASEVSEVGSGPAIQRVRLLDEVEGLSGSTSTSSNTLNSDILDYYTMLAERGDVQAQVGLGQLHFQGGRGVSPDHHLALRYFKRAAESGSPVAMAFLGKMFLEGNDAVDPDPSKALRWFQKAAEQGSPVGQSGLGLMYLQGRGLPRDPSKALQYFTMAAEQGWVDGQLHLGNLYMAGIGVRRDYQQAAKYYNLAAQSGHILAIYNLAQMHATGTGMMRSCTAAVELYKTVAERGRWGLLLSEAHSEYKEKKFSSSLVKYLLLSELGYETAQANAAFMLERGEVGYEVFEAWRRLGNETNEEKEKEKKEKEKEDVVVVKKQEVVDNVVMSNVEAPKKKTRKALGLASPEGLLSLALQQWARSAAQGYSAARVRLGDYYYYGWGTETDFTSAASQYRLASEQQRNPQAMFNLAYMHEQGLGLKQDLHLAKRFYDMAAETSLDARIPVTLALIKLNFMYTLKTFKLFDMDPPQPNPVIITTEQQGDINKDTIKDKSSSSSSSSGDEDPFASLGDAMDLGANWDLYLLTLLVGILGVLVWLRRPVQQGQGGAGNRRGPPDGPLPQGQGPGRAGG